MVWKSMAQLRERTEGWDVRKWQAGRPRDFTEVGNAIRAGRSWDLAWGDWLHEFVYRKEARSLAAEPPSWFSGGTSGYDGRGRRVLCATSTSFPSQSGSTNRNTS